VAEHNELAPDELRAIRREHTARMARVAEAREAADLVRRWERGGRRSAEAREVLIAVGQALGVIARDPPREA
jgi:DNA-binding transcriptional regulator YiaG